jgi:hypothetical protein
VEISPPLVADDEAPEAMQPGQCTG